MGRLQYAVLNQPSLLDYRSDTGNYPPNTGAGIPSTTRTRPAMHSLVMFYRCRRRWGGHGSFGPAVARNTEVLGSTPGRVRCLPSRLCTYSVPNCSKA